MQINVLQDLPPQANLEDLPSSTDSAATLATAESWLRICLNEHDCQLVSSQAFANRVLPTRLIQLNIPKPRLILTSSLDSDVEYATLSHCWGSAKQFALNGANLETMQQAIPLELLSKTFQESMVLANRFGYDYLWIDSLCIIQDDAHDWRHESTLMSSVYGGSSLNIAASHARDGSEGCFSHRPRSLLAILPASANFQTQEPVACIPTDLYSRGLLNTALRSRAWAFQERFLSPRTLHFSNSQLFWSCQHLEACEIFPTGIPAPLRTSTELFFHDDKTIRRHSLRSLLSKEPDLWADVVLAYSSGLLTHQEDKLVAISGIARLVYEVTTDVYLAGLWKTNLEWQLLWSVSRSSERGYSVDKMISYRAPSWSWASVNGIIRQLFPDPSPNGTAGYCLLININSASTLHLHDDPFGQISDGVISLSTHGLLQIIPPMRAALDELHRSEPTAATPYGDYYSVLYGRLYKHDSQSREEYVLKKKIQSLNHSHKRWLGRGFGDAIQRGDIRMGTTLPIIFSDNGVRLPLISGTLIPTGVNQLIDQLSSSGPVSNNELDMLGNKRKRDLEGYIEKGPDCELCPLHTSWDSSPLKLKDIYLLPVWAVKGRDESDLSFGGGLLLERSGKKKGEYRRVGRAEAVSLTKLDLYLFDRTAGVHNHELYSNRRMPGMKHTITII
jgi:hypothetical protein